MYRETAFEVGHSLLRPDVVAVKGESGNARYIAFEVKPDYLHEGESRGLRGIINQVNAYYDSGYFDELYIASTREGAYKLAEWSGKSIEQVICRSKEIDVVEMPIPDFGVYSIEGSDCSDFHIECIKPSPIMKRSMQPQLSLGEADYGQLLFEHFKCERKDTIIPEAVIPDTSRAASPVLNRIDFMIMNSSSDPRQVFKDRHDSSFSITGIEVKYQVDRSAKMQLASYQNSGCLSFLYLAVPDTIQDNEAIKQILSELPDVGLITISEKGEVSERKSANRLELRYDSIKFNGVISLIGDGTKVDNSFSPFYPDKKEELCDKWHALPIDEKERRKKSILENTYATEESCKGAIDVLYCMFGAETSYRCVYDHKRKGYVIC